MNKVSEDFKALYVSHNAVLVKVKALVESNMTMEEKLSRVQEDLENMSEEEIQLLEGTSDKLKLHESTKIAHDFEDPCDNLCCSLSKSHGKLKEQTMVLENSKLTMFNEQRKLNNSSFMGYHFGITPTFFINADHLEIKITPSACGPLHRKEICPKVRNYEPCNIVGTVEMFWIDMYLPFTNHSFEHPLALKMMCGYEVSEKLNFVIIKWSGEFVSNDKEILATWKGIKCFKFLGALAMVYAEKKDDVYYKQQRMIEFDLIGLEGHTPICDGVLINFLVGIVVHGFNYPTNQGSRSCYEYPFVGLIQFAGLIQNETCLLKFWAVIYCFGVIGVFNGEKALRYLCSGRSPLMKIATTPCGQGVFQGKEMLGML